MCLTYNLSINAKNMLLVFVMCCSRSRAFFTAPVAGDYRFMLTADDFAHLNATYRLVRRS